MKWKPIPGFENYEITKNGLVRSWICRNGKRKKPFMLKLFKCKGYTYVTMFKDGKHRRITSRLVLKTFGPPRPSAAHNCAHNDGNKDNNHISNLRWATHEENMQDMLKHAAYRCGEKSHFAKLKNNQVLEIRKKHKNGQSNASVAKEYNISSQTVYQITRRQSWKHI